jgi:aryl-alcohol dehydrogenase-like predicted oxidoreductase
VYNQGESESIVGTFLKDNKLRDQIILATKVYNRTSEKPNAMGATRYHIVKACEDSLRRLQTDHIDLYQLHRPQMSLPQDETLRALDDLIHAGKVLYIGTSTYPAWMVMEALGVSERYGLNRYISEQPPYNLLDRRIENEMIPLAQKHDLAILPWSPTGMGILAGRYTQTDRFPEGSRVQLWNTNDAVRARVTPRALEVAKAVSQMAQDRRISTSQLALLWVKDQPGITAPIVGPRTLAHLEDALPILEMALDDADRQLFDTLVHPGNAVADFYNSNDWMKARIVE